MLPDHNEATEPSVLFLKSPYHFLASGQERHLLQSYITSLLQVIHSASTFTDPGAHGGLQPPQNLLEAQHSRTEVYPVWKLWLRISCVMLSVWPLPFAAGFTINMINFIATVQDLLAHFWLHLRDFITPQWTMQFPNNLVYALSYTRARRQIEMSAVNQLL